MVIITIIVIYYCYYHNWYTIIVITKALPAETDHKTSASVFPFSRNVNTFPLLLALFLL